MLNVYIYKIYTENNLIKVVIFIDTLLFALLQTISVLFYT